MNHPGCGTYFNPRSPHGERHRDYMALDVSELFQPTLPARGATKEGMSVEAWVAISTHAPRTGSDCGKEYIVFGGKQFQPTLPARGATSSSSDKQASSTFQPTLPARGATLAVSAGALVWVISTHAPRTGSDGGKSRCKCAVQISTHAPRTGSDRKLGKRGCFRFDFNPRSPHGERRGKEYIVFGGKQFQPTLPARGATHLAEGRCPEHWISTHAPRTGSDPYTSNARQASAYFNPRSPHGERHCNLRATCVQLKISTHAPRTGSDWNIIRERKRVVHFNPRSPHGERPLVNRF